MCVLDGVLVVVCVLDGVVVCVLETDRVRVREIVAVLVWAWITTTLAKNAKTS